MGRTGLNSVGIPSLIEEHLAASGRANGQAPLPENVSSLMVSRRTWNGVCVTTAEFQCTGRVCHHLGFEGETRLNAVLEEGGSQCEPRLKENKPCPIAHTPRHMFFATPGMELWGYGADVRSVKDANLTFDLAALDERMSTGIDSRAISTPRLRFSDDRIWTLVKLLAAAVNDPDPSSQLYGDGLTIAIVAKLFASSPQSEKEGGKGLATWQLRRVFEYLDEHLPQRVELEHLATLIGMSQSHFSRAFKASTGLAPYRWQLDARIRRAQVLLIDGHASLEHVAEATGFADAVHFGRTFRKFTGVTPAIWRHDRKS